MTVLLPCLAVLCLLFAFGCSLQNMDWIPAEYDRDLHPGYHDGTTTRVLFGLYIYQIGPLSESDMSMSADIYLRAYWNDSRLQYAADYLFNRSSMNRSNDTEEQPFVNLKGAYADAIWRPNIYFLDSMVENTPAEVSQSSITVLTRSSLVMSSKRVVLKSRCALDLSSFPLDRQKCPLCFSSYEYKDSEQLISWKEYAVDIDKNLNSTATFDIVAQLENETIVQNWGPGIMYTKLCVHVQFKRKFHIYIVTMFLPSISLVGLSWVSFWIDKKAVPARAGLTITTILAQITLITGTANKFPGVADLKIGDIYMIINFFFVFGSLIEFAIVNNSNKTESASASPAESKKRPASLVYAKENNNFLANERSTNNHVGEVIRSTSFGVNNKTPEREAIELLSDENNYSVMSTPYGKHTTPNRNLLESTAKKVNIPEREQKLGFSRRLYMHRDIDDISKVVFPVSFLVWHAIFILMGHFTLNIQGA
ncbi:gamma-aminobutyric acid receptor subunit alpha-6-like isoform X2 [Convolutriloba macropyga]|uniref:gamma-aminobutyric acid receptor subunit alpha-6-like isoform X2 n=1 Tax=Convolutriloba macropyga TaxID=536237 RepID=UPI003F51D449